MPQQRANSGRAGADPAGERRRWLGERDAHGRQINAYSFVMPDRLKRSATKRPAALRFSQHLPASRLVRLLLLVAAPAYTALQVAQGTQFGRAITVSLILAAVIFTASTLRLTVGNHGISFDIAGIRQVSSFGFVPLYAVREAISGSAPADWPKAKLKGGWWPGRRKVTVLHRDETGAARTFKVWVRDPEAFGGAVLGRPMSD